MAPIKKRARARTKASRPATSTPPSAPSTTPSASGSKILKRRAKHEALLSRLSSRVTKPRRRRGAKTQLAAKLDDLLSALPEDDEDEWEGISDHDDGAQVKMKLKSARSRPGAMKTRLKLEREERERFARNMAQMVGAKKGETKEMDARKEGEGEEQTQAQKDRWAALRGFIGQTMQQNFILQQVITLKCVEPLYQRGP
ncbi:hypothetical protein ANO11243_075370 [Dothideomycetidae sp. 11243]|nr:hypothetical protein ANO11243_075370 [fungal sp. No.11243]